MMNANLDNWKNVLIPFAITVTDINVKYFHLLPIGSFSENDHVNFSSLTFSGQKRLPSSSKIVRYQPK